MSAQPSGVATAAFCRYEDRGSYLKMRLQSPAMPARHLTHQKPLLLNLYGDIRRGLPAAARPALGLFLPLARGKYLSWEDSSSDGVTARLGPVTRAMVESGLDGQISSGDPLIVFELLQDTGKMDPESVCYVPTRASLIKQNLQNGGSIIASPSAADLQKALSYRPAAASKAAALLRSVFCSAVACVGNWLLALKTTSILTLLPALPFFSRSQRSIASVLPIQPVDMLQAFDLGGLVRELQSGAAAESVLLEAQKIVGRAVTVEQLHALRDTLHAALHHRSVAQRVWGFFNFVNMMWLLAICGIAVSVGPVLWLISAPIRQLLMKLGRKVMEVVQWLLENVLVPLVLRCHNYCILEVAAFLLASCLVMQGARMPPDSGLYVSISGLLALHAASAYSASLHGQRLLKVMGPSLKPFAGVLPMLYTMPLAIHYRSTLLAYFTTMAGCHILGFSVLIFPFCYVIGWENHDSMVKSAAVGGGVLALYTAAAAAGVEPSWLAPFRSPVSVFGGILLYLALLILSNVHYPRGGYRRRGPSSSYLRVNAVALATLLLGVLAGRVVGMEGLANTATTFLVLWLLEKYIDLHTYAEWNAWVLMLLSSATMYKCALWLHANPQFVVSMFSG